MYWWRLYIWIPSSSVIIFKESTHYKASKGVSARYAVILFTSINCSISLLFFLRVAYMVCPWSVISCLTPYNIRRTRPINVPSGKYSMIGVYFNGILSNYHNLGRDVSFNIVFVKFSSPQIDSIVCIHSLFSWRIPMKCGSKLIVCST